MLPTNPPVEIPSQDDVESLILELLDDGMTEEEAEAFVEAFLTR